MNSQETLRDGYYGEGKLWIAKTTRSAVRPRAPARVTIVSDLQNYRRLLKNFPRMAAYSVHHCYVLEVLGAAFLPTW